MPKETVATVLTYSGTLPFILAILGLFYNPLGLGLDYHYLVLSYGAVITSFIAGIHWGSYLTKSSSLNLFIHSNLIALAAWCAFLTSVHNGTLILIGCFIYLLFLDRHLWHENLIEGWFFRVRLRASIIVILALAISLFPLI